MRSKLVSGALLMAGVALGAASIHLLKNKVQSDAVVREQTAVEQAEADSLAQLDPLFFVFTVEDVVVKWVGGKAAMTVSVSLSSRQVSLDPLVRSNIKKVVDRILLRFAERPDALSSGSATEIAALKKDLLSDLNSVLSEAKVVDLSFEDIRVLKSL